jgi:hypothetical protein
MQGVLTSWMLRLFIHLLFVGPSRQSTRDGFLYHSGRPDRTFRDPLASGGKPTLSTYGHKTLWKLLADLWHGDLTLAEKTLTPLTPAHLIEGEGGSGFLHPALLEL